MEVKSNIKGGAPASIIDVTYAALKALVNASQMVIDQEYRITDFRTVYNAYDDVARIITGALEPLIVTALTPNQLAKEAYSELYPEDTIYYYLPLHNQLFNPDWSPYSGAYYGVITYRHDRVRDISAHYDWRSLEFRLWEDAIGSGLYFNVSSTPGHAYIDKPMFSSGVGVVLKNVHIASRGGEYGRIPFVVFYASADKVNIGAANDPCIFGGDASDISTGTCTSIVVRQYCQGLNIGNSVNLKCWGYVAGVRTGSNLYVEYNGNLDSSDIMTGYDNTPTRPDAGNHVGELIGYPELPALVFDQNTPGIVSISGLTAGGRNILQQVHRINTPLNSLANHVQLLNDFAVGTRIRFIDNVDYNFLIFLPAGHVFAGATLDDTYTVPGLHRTSAGQHYFCTVDNTTGDTVELQYVGSNTWRAQFFDVTAYPNGYIPTSKLSSTLKVDLALVKADVGLGNVEDTALSTWAGSTNITTLGAVTAISATTPLIIGGTAVGSKITYKSTTGAGTPTGIAHQFLGGTNGATVLLTGLNNGNWGVGKADPSYPLDVVGGIRSGLILIGNANNTIDTTSGDILNLSTVGATRVVIQSPHMYPNVNNGYKLGISTKVWSELWVNGLTATNGKVGFKNTAPTALIHPGAGTAAAGTAPLKFTSGPLLTTPEAGAVEFLTDAFYATITTGAARKQIAFTGYTVAPAAITVGASPFVYQNATGYTAEIICSGGTVTEIAISRDGTTYYPTGLTSGTPVLGPGDRVKVTYSATPTMTSFAI